MTYKYHVYKSGRDTLLAFCDSGLFGKTLKGKVTFEVKKEFYGPEIGTDAKLKSLLKQATIINAVGKEAVALLIREEYADEEHVLYIGDVPHAQVVFV